MTIQRTKTEKKSGTSFSVGVNIILAGSKAMTPEQQEKALTVAKVRVLIVDADNPKNVLVDETAPAREFSTGSVGYGLNIRSAEFKQ